MKIDTNHTNNCSNYLSENEINKILIAAKSNNNHFLWIGLIYSTGITVKELINIKVRDINTENMTLSIPNDKRVQRKNIVLPSQFYPHIHTVIHRKKTEDFIFKGRKGRVHSRTILKMLEKIKKITGLDSRVNNIRKSLAIHLYLRGWNEKKICLFLGHSSINSTRKMLKGISILEENLHPIHNMHLNVA
jgi:site-specific recombinase XerD